VPFAATPSPFEVEPEPPRPRPSPRPLPRYEDEDEEDRPRPRRRDPERHGEPGPARKSAAPLFWGVIVGCLVVIGLIALVVWKLRHVPAEWRTYESPRGGFKVDLPAAPRTDLGRQAELPTVPGTSAEGTTHRRDHYAVLWGEIPNRQWRTDEQIIDDTVSEARGPRRAVFLEKGEPFTVGGFPARDVLMTSFDGDSGVLRVIVADTRLYVLVAVGPDLDEDDPDVRRFLNSFEITDPRLKNSR
jgi:hypothetical protein